MSIELNVQISGSGHDDTLAKRLIRDLRSSVAIENASQATRASSGRDKGLVEDIGTVAVTILNSVGAEVLMTVLRGLLPKRPQSAQICTITITLPTGKKVELSGPLTEAEFSTTTRQILDDLDIGGKNATA